MYSALSGWQCSRIAFDQIARILEPADSNPRSPESELLTEATLWKPLQRYFMQSIAHIVSPIHGTYCSSDCVLSLGIAKSEIWRHTGKTLRLVWKWSSHVPQRCLILTAELQVVCDDCWLDRFTLHSQLLLLRASWSACCHTCLDGKTTTLSQQKQNQH